MLYIWVSTTNVLSRNYPPNLRGHWLARAELGHGCTKNLQQLRLPSANMEAFSTQIALGGSFAAYRRAEDANEQTWEANEQTKIAIANRHARSAGQLTKITTVIVPCSFVASIFSMGGAFGAGEHLFFVHWARSVTITVALLSWVLHGDIKKMWRK